jgi:Myb/SANT-like DNA-binding domain
MGEAMRGMREAGVVAGGRVPQWGQQETRELIAIRGEMEMGKRSAGASGYNNNTLWEEVAARMSQRGYSRTPEQCKCKWKNLVNRYKVRRTHALFLLFEFVGFGDLWCC